MNPDGVLTENKNVEEIAIPSKFAGAVIFNVDQAFEAVKDNDNYNGSYRGIAGKKFVFEYDYSNSNCVAGTKRIVIVVYE
jgi:hypothetical protein